MPIASGSRLGAYEVIAAIGSGGMGEVWRARDTRLHRDVALKVLPDLFASDPERLARFHREAQLLASLNHPHIAAIHGFEEADGVHALVLELVDGPTLADRIAEGPLPLEEALTIARQIADALEAAHDKGIIHRDLKPANVKLTAEGQVKVLDFGLAKLLEPNGVVTGAPAALSPALINSPTVTSPAMTMAGVILGTAAYMSPEHARGKNVDKRADIWAFGVLLYELVTGRKPFDGEDVADTLARILQREPQWENVPFEVQRLLRKCLEKDPRRRLRDIGDAWELLDTPTTLPAARRSSWAIRSAFGMVTLAALAFGIISAIHFREVAPVLPLVKFEIPSPPGVVIQKFAVSPDGRKVAFFASDATGRGSVWVRSLDSTESRRLVDTVASPSLTWSPDSREIAFPGVNDITRLMKIDVSGGPIQTVCDMHGVGITGASWGRNGTILIGTITGGVSSVPASGGNPSPVTTIDVPRQEFQHSTPTWLQDGKHFLYLRMSSTPENSGIFVGSIETTPAHQPLKRLIATVFAPAYTPARDGATRGYLLFRSDDGLRVQPFNETTLDVDGTSVQLADHVGSVFEFGNVSVSDSNVLAYRTGVGQGVGQVQLTWMTRTGQPLGAAIDPGYYYASSLNGEASRVAVARLDVGGRDAPSARMELWVRDLIRQTMTRLASERLQNVGPVWSPDGAQLAYSSGNAAKLNIYRRPSNGAGAEEVLLDRPGLRLPTDWSHDGRYLLYEELTASRTADLWVLPLTGDRQPSRYTDSSFDEEQAQFSPDGHWIAYASNESGRYEVYVQPFPLNYGGGGKWTVSSNGGLQPRWRRDGRELLYLGPDGRTVWAADVNLRPTFSVGAARRVTDVPFVIPPGGLTGSFVWNVTPDGNRFLVMTTPKQDANSAPITVVMNWMNLLKP